ncbi:hypothetical protein Tco_0209590 [Tanacetum coccineum]
MYSDKYLEGQFMQRPSLFESDHFIYWKNRFKTYVKTKDLDRWHIILNGDFPPVAKNEVTQILEVVSFEEQFDDLKKKLAKNNKAKMVLYNALPKKEYEIIFMCKAAKDIWQSLLITHQGNRQVKNNKIDLLVQKYEQFTILEKESIDSGFARFNTIITSLKALDEGFSSKNYVMKLLRALHPKWRAKVTSIEESKDLSSLALDEFIGNLKVHEVVLEKDSEIYKGKKERIKSIALKAKKESSEDETSTSESDDEEYAMAVRNFKKFFRRKGKFIRKPREEKKSFRQRDEKKGKSDWKYFRCSDPNHLIAKMTPKTKLTTKLVSWLNHQMSLKIINKNKILKDKRDLLENEILELNKKIKKLERSKENEFACKSCEELKSKNAKLKETQVKFVKFDKSANSLREMLNNQKSPSCKIGLGFDSSKASTSGTKTMSFVGSSAEKAMDGSTLPGSVSRTNGEKGTKHVFSPPMSSRSDFVITRKKLIHNSIDESKKPSLKPSLKSGIGYVKTESRSKTPPPRRNISSQPRHNTPQPRRNSREPIHQNFYPMNWNNHQSQGFVHMGNCLQIKQMEDGIFFNQSKYIKEMLKKFGLEDSKPTKTKTPMSTKIKLNKDDEADSVDSSKYRGEITTYINQMDCKRTKEYLPRVYRTRQMDDELRESYRTLKKHLFHEGRIVTLSFIAENNMLPYFQDIGLEPFLTLNEPICPRFIVEFYHSLEVKRDEEICPYIEFTLGQFSFKLTSYQLSQILQTPYALDTFYTSEWSLNFLIDHPNSNFFGPKHNLVKRNITIPRTTQTQLQRDLNKFHLDKIHPELRGWELFFSENLFCSLDKRNKVNASIVPPTRFTFHEHVMDPLDISRNPSKEKGKNTASPSIISSSSSSSDGNEAPSFLEFYDELSNSEDPTKA